MNDETRWNVEYRTSYGKYGSTNEIFDVGDLVLGDVWVSFSRRSGTIFQIPTANVVVIYQQKKD